MIPSAPHLTRAADQPLLRIGDHAAIGTNINGPSVLRVPEWVPDPKGKFYMYFAHHTGTSIRIAVADDPLGGWRVLDAPALHLSETGFAQTQVTHCSETGEVITEPPHIASPDVHVCEQDRQVMMFFHGLHADGRQTTQVARSRDGLSFSVEGCGGDIAPPYLKVCRVGDRFVGVTWGGEMLCADHLAGPFTKAPLRLRRPNGPDLIPRHPVLGWRDGVLHCFYSSIGDCPERLWHMSAKTAGPMAAWAFSAPALILSPEFEWEGAGEPKAVSRIGMAQGLEHALRDPALFEDLLFYVGGGEHSIAVAHIHW